MSGAKTSVQTVEVRFKGTRKGYFTWSDPEPLRLNEAVIVEVERGKDFGRVSATGQAAEKKCTSCASGGCSIGDLGETKPEPPKPVLRRASQDDIRQHNEGRRSEEEVRRKVIERVRHHALVMKVSDTEWQWDRNKLTIYFTAEKRVDFRALVRDLASQFRTRIELRQIGVRDEAARLAGVGRCGREYCCSTWLTELSPINLALAKDQHLSLNPSQISGGCGRLLCCLKYEHDFYVAARKRFPKEGKSLRTSLGLEKVIAVDIFRERVFLKSEEHGNRIIPLLQLREEVERLGDVFPTIESRQRQLASTSRPAEASGTAAQHLSSADADGESEDGVLDGDASIDPTPSGPAAERGPRRRRRRRRGGRSGEGQGPDEPPLEE
ncbi:MAG TPA: regulatory iron-sulfur-containing complex subunit RicT [Gemmatimonadales bacterium]|nr:regulatory iron-sulfur-containing complex subunit RicT [Gemmatimonadales bacterium]